MRCLWLRSWDWWGNLIYFLASLAYVFLDVTSGFFSDNPYPSLMPDSTLQALWLTMSIVFFVDSLIYMISWFSYARREARAMGTAMFVESWFWGEFFNVISSAGWVLVAYLAYTVPPNPTLGDILRYWIAYGLTTMLSAALMFVSNWLYFTGYRTDRVDELEKKPNSKRRKLCGFTRELVFWAVLFDFIGGACYIVGSVWLSLRYVNLLSFLPFMPDDNESFTPASAEPFNSLAISSNYSTRNCTFDQLSPAELDESAKAWDAQFTAGDGISCRYFLFGDLSYTIDSLLYILLWYREHRRSQMQQDFNPYASLKETPDLTFPTVNSLYSDRIDISS